MRPSLFLLPTVLVIAIAVACQPAAESPATPAAPAVAAAPAAPTPTPADLAGSTAESFRAVGNEPGWLAQVDSGKETVLHVEIDYGQTRHDVTAPTQGADGWAGTTADGTPVKLSVQRVPCQDGMSGKQFQAKAMLTVGTRQLHGCGNFSASASEPTPAR